MRGSVGSRLFGKRHVSAGCAAALLACSSPGGDGGATPGAPESANGVPASAGSAVLAREVARLEAEASRVDSIFQPMSLLRPAEEASLMRYGNAQQLSRARSLGVGRLHPAERLEALQRDSSLVELVDTEHWVVRGLDHSQPLVVPAVRRLLTEIGTRFHAKLAEAGVPPYRFEVSSVLRTAADQAALRRVNPNAAEGESTHEYGTTVDVLYSAFAAPARPLLQPEVAEAAWLDTHLRRYSDVLAERVAGRRAHELKAILGRVLLELQGEGRVMVTLERLQPVFHMTVAQ
jgi:hypothetical protein